ncbi:hypothetical protein [Wenxinia marina]|uniref:BON domain-containing protein n=1 Tax=Wenxinia marina DSM 24838 TaxID=1123501 RepID=A0A0D0Q5Y4_9RHOB|nr:hypothetical protein [Wenxinia marina]KIQ69889.1 hypothetical protein Wenmar_01459 [Wenxinia marina DSM 24838]GGL62005.1 hypothetical protein GCM10011392_15620 [Wenxinia marina]
MKGLVLSLPFAAALTVPAAAQTQDDLDRFLAIVAQNGCVITAENGAVIQQQSGMTDQQLEQLMLAIARANGLAQGADNTLRVVAGPCAG